MLSHVVFAVSAIPCLFDYQIGFEDFCCVTLNKTSLLVESDIPPKEVLLLSKSIVIIKLKFQFRPKSKLEKGRISPYNTINKSYITNNISYILTYMLCIKQWSEAIT